MRSVAVDTDQHHPWHTIWRPTCYLNFIGLICIVIFSWLLANQPQSMWGLSAANQKSAAFLNCSRVVFLFHYSDRCWTGHDNLIPNPLWLIHVFVRCTVITEKHVTLTEGVNYILNARPVSLDPKAFGILHHLFSLAIQPVHSLCLPA